MPKLPPPVPWKVVVVQTTAKATAGSEKLARKRDLEIEEMRLKRWHNP